MNISDARTETGSVLTGKGGEWMDYIKNVASVLEMVEPVDGVIKISADVRDLLVKLLRGQERWISVEDRLPETRHAVLVYTPHHKNIWAASMHEDGNWYIWSPGGRVLLDPDWHGPITHWMPLPEPPEVKQDD